MSGNVKTFKYKSIPLLPFEYSPAGINRVGSSEYLGGIVQEKSASDLEERVARAFDKLNVTYEFRARISSLAVGNQKLIQTGANLPGELEIDHLVYLEQVIPVLVDGQISHFMTPYQKLDDQLKTDAINTFGKSLGWHEVMRIPFTELKNQDEADSVARRIVDGVYIPTGQT